MPCYQGTYYTKTFLLKNASDATAIDVSGYEFEMHIRDQPEDDAPLLELTTANGGIDVGDNPSAGQVVLALTAAQTASLPVGKMHFDVLRTDQVNGPTYLFGGRFLVRQPITRDD